MDQTTSRIDGVSNLITHVLQNRFEIDPSSHSVVGTFSIRQNTRFVGASETYRNHYLLLRVATTFGGCCVEPEELNGIDVESLAGNNLAQLLEHPQLPVRIAALDAYFGMVRPHRREKNIKKVELPLGTPYERAVARDQAIVGQLGIQVGESVGLIGVVNPIVDEIERRGGVCLPCDFNMKRTQSGLTVTRDMRPILDKADRIIATGMTLSNGSFDEILSAARKRDIPLVVYAQTGSSIVPRFLGDGVQAICAEPFPYSQFSAEPTSVYLYNAD